MEAGELYDLCVEIATGAADARANGLMHQVLVTCCAEATRSTGQGYGSLFAQLDYVCRHNRLSARHRAALQQARRHSNARSVPSREELLADVRALSLLIAAVTGTAVPDRLVRLLPAETTTRPADGRADARYLRCIVTGWDQQWVFADSDHGPLRIVLGEDEAYVRALLRPGMQLNLLDSKVGSDAAQPVVTPGLTVVEPDFLVDVSAVAACFTEHGRQPLTYIANRLKPRPNSQPILLGNFASAALDDIINHGQPAVNATIMRSFREQALQFCACDPFDGRKFTDDAAVQSRNLKEVVDLLFSSGDYDRTKAILEPSFVCERLGLQGRVDLMTTDKRLLVEQKSGRNLRIERHAAIRHREDHYVQLLLYYGILRQNFRLRADDADIRLLYSKYPAREGLLVVNYYGQLFREAIRQRNLIVAWEYFVAREGFAAVLPHVAPRLELSPLEHDYLNRMMTFVYREQLCSKVGVEEGRGGAESDLWNMPLTTKTATGNILAGLTLTAIERSTPTGGYDLLTLSADGHGDELLLPNFRRGDSVYLYAYEGEPDVRRSILFKGTLQAISSDRLTVRLNDAQQNVHVFGGTTWAVEHGGGDAGTRSNARGLLQLMTCAASRRHLLLGQRPPVANTSLQLTRSYHPHYDEVLLRAKQARDYFLLVGPPGTGKTSMALRFLVEEELASLQTSRPQPPADGVAAILLTAYTNRAVDEICGMLTEAGLDYLRLGNETSCDARFRSRLLDVALGSSATLAAVRSRLAATPIVVGTTSMLQARPFIFSLKRFSLCIVDEASQILEPAIVGLLSQDIGRFILVGDHKQLPAVVQQPAAQTRVSEPRLLAIGLTDCRHSLFERLLRWEQQCERTQFTGILRRQGRMHPDVAAFPNRMFYRREQLLPVPLAHQTDTSLHYDLPARDALDQLLQRERVAFFDLPHPAAEARFAQCSPTEAAAVAVLLSRIHRFYGARFDADKTVGVIVPYRNQIALIRREIERLQLAGLERVSIDTVERYQGSQRDVIIYSFTVGRAFQLDFLTDNCFEEDGCTIDRKLNVALTRARKQMLMVGDARILRKNGIFRELITFYEKKVLIL